MLLGAVSTAIFNAHPAHADQITVRSLTLQAGTDGPDADSIPDGGSQPSGNANHFFQFTVPTVGSNIGSIKFEYCTTADINIGGTCTTPTGLVTTSATLGSEGANATGFTLDTTTNGAPFLSKVTPAAPLAGELSYQLQGITNPDGTDCATTTPNCTFFVRITTYTGSDGATGQIDAGTVAASTSTQIVLTGTMPESLIFCTGGTVGVNGGGIPDCSTATSGAVSFNQLFSPTATATATSQMAASTNALSGYAITVNGPTLTSGANTIQAVGSTAAASTVGSGQFGMNLMANITPTVGTDVTPVANGTNHRGQPSANFNTADSFAFSTSGNAVAASDNGGAGPTDSQIFTASYIVNVSGSQPAGTYTTTLTYICTPTF